MLLGSCHHTLGKIRGKVVITVHELQIFALCQPHTHIAGDGKALVFLVHHRHAGVFCTKLIADRKAVIRRAIVQHDDLQLLIGLAANTFQTAGNTILRVIHRHDNADERVCHDRDLLLTIRFGFFRFTKARLCKKDVIIYIIILLWHAKCKGMGVLSIREQAVYTCAQSSAVQSGKN